MNKKTSSLLQRTVEGLDIYKDSVFLCILNESGKIFESKYVVLTTEFKEMLTSLPSVYMGIPSINVGRDAIMGALSGAILGVYIDCVGK